MPALGVNMIVIEDGRTLLTLREDFEVWCIPGGAVDPGETTAQAAIREMCEETGLETAITRLVGVYSRPDWPGGYHILAYAGRITGGVMRADPNEVRGIAWFALEALPPLMLSGHARRIHDAARVLSGASGSVARLEAIGYPAGLPLPRPELYAARDAEMAAEGISRSDFYLRHFAPLEGPGQLEAGAPLHNEKP